MDVNVLNCDMNDKQKLFVMVATGSLAVFLITMSFLGFDGEVRVEDYKVTNGSIIKKKNDVKYYFIIPAKSKNGEKLDLVDLLDGKYETTTNWLGIIAVFNIVLSATGFFLFKDK